MNFAQIHLGINHGPVFGFLFGVALLLYGKFRKQQDVMKAALWTFVAAALFTVPVYLTGDPAEHVVKNLPEVQKSAIEEHDNSATFALIGTSVVGVFALGLLYIGRKTTPALWMRTMFLCLAIICCGILLRTAALGGKIHHSETRSGFIVPPGGDDEND